MALTNLDAQHPTILLVDDDPVVLRIMAKHLKKRGNTVVAADKPLHALKFAEQRGSDIRIVIRDVVMPEMDGCELGARVRAIHPDIPILFVSGQDYGRLQ